MIDIYYTVAPASEAIADTLIAAGATGARLTFSYGTPEVQLERARECKAAARAQSRDIRVMADLPGGSTRLPEFSLDGEHHFMVEQDEHVGICDHGHTKLSSKMLPLPKEILEILENDQILVIGDGVVAFRVIKNYDGFAAVAVSSGRIENNRGVTVQGGVFEPVCLTEKDRETLLHLRENEEYDEVALSFVSSAADVEAARTILGDTQKKIIAKVETPQGVKRIKEIAAAADEIMVARGDLALTMPWTQMPKAVDTIVEACVATNTPYIMATQVAESMSTSPMMSRAEMTDLWQWKKRGVSGVLLSRETGWGDHPEKAVAAVRALLDEKI